MGWVFRRFGLPPGLPGLAPAGDLLLWTPKEVGKKTAPTKPPTLRVGALRCSNDEARAQLAPLCSAQTVARSQTLKRAAHAPRRSALLGGFEGGVPQTAQQPTAKPPSRSPRGISLPPFSTAEQRKTLRACAKRTSTSDSVRLSDRSVAKRVAHGPSRSEQRREPRATRGAVRSGALSLPTFLCAQESRSPAGANSRLGLTRNAVQPEASPCL